MMHFDVLIIGGGAIGVSTLYHLHRLGVGNLALVERATLASENTSRAAGIVSQLAWDETDARLVGRSRELYQAVQAEVPDQVIFRETGMWTVAGSPEQKAALDERSRMLARAGVQVEARPAADLSRVFPQLRSVDLTGAWYTPGDGHVNATDYVAHLGRGLRQAGVGVFENTPVRRLIVEGGRVAGVEMDEGRIGADVVIVAGGVWSRRLLQTAGFDVPLKPYRTQICVVEGLSSADLPVLHDMALDFYWVPETGDKLIFGDGTEEWESDPDDYNRRNDESFILSVAERLNQRLVDTDRVNIARGWAGLCAATPDRRPLLGPYAGVEGLHLAIGFNGFGVMRSPAVGEAVAQMVAEKSPVINVDSHLARRFSGFVDFPIAQGFSRL